MRWLRLLGWGMTFVFAAASAEETPPQTTDYLSFAQGAYPLPIAGDAAALRLEFSHALQLIDGNSGGFSLTPKPAPAEAVLELTYQLPALTTFTEFSVPNIFETPSPFQTFVRHIVISGATDSPDGPYAELAQAELTTHATRGEATTFMAQKIPARWVKVRLKGGIDAQKPNMFLEFSELIGRGSQEPAPLQEGFGGKWKGRGAKLALEQTGAVVQGCYDADGELSGTVTGAVLRATGTSQTSGVSSTFVLTKSADDVLIGVRSTNGAPFRLLQAQTHNGVISCAPPPTKSLGCGSVIHGISFEFDSAEIRPEAQPLVDDLYAGLRDANTKGIVVEGHTSSEGSHAYNLDLSQRRADAVMQALNVRGEINAELKAQGIGEVRPIAENDTEAGRSLNRRVEIVCH